MTPKDEASAKNALLDAAKAWQEGGGASAPRKRKRSQERIAHFQYVTDWLREQAEQVDTRPPEKRCKCDGGSYEVKKHPFIVSSDCMIHGKPVDVDITQGHLHDPWDAVCVKRVAGEPSRPSARCAWCRPEPEITVGAERTFPAHDSDPDANCPACSAIYDSITSGNEGSRQ